MGSNRPFRFGVLGGQVRSGRQLVETARRAEELGYATLLLRDHFVAEPFGDQLAPMVALTAAAGATRTLRVGSLVLDNDYRHPVLLAKEAATLDLLSEGRFELGIGAGWLRGEYRRAGLPFDPPGVRVGRLEESLRILKGLFAGCPLTFSGRHYAITELEGFPPPAQRPHPPLLIGASSRRMLGIAGREADIVSILPRALPNGTISGVLHERSSAAVAQQVEWVHQAAGERFQQVELNAVISVVVADDHRKAAERLATDRGWGSAAAQECWRCRRCSSARSAGWPSRCRHGGTATTSPTTLCRTRIWTPLLPSSTASPANDPADPPCKVQPTRRFCRCGCARAMPVSPATAIPYARTSQHPGTMAMRLPGA